MVSSCATSEVDDRTTKELRIDVITDSCLSLRADFNYGYANLSGYTSMRKRGRKFLTNRAKNRVYTFDKSTGELVHKKLVPAEGPLSVGGAGHFDGTFWISKDSLLYSSNVENKISLLQKDTVITVVDYSASDDSRLMNRFSFNALESKNHYLFPIYPGSKESFRKTFTYVAIDKQLKEYREVFDETAVYADKYYGSTPYLYWPSLVFNERKQTYLIAYPIDHNIYEYNSDFELIATYPFFHEEIGEIETYPYALNDEGDPEYQENNKYYRSIAYFIKLFYLLDSDQYVRLARTVDPEDGTWIFHLVIHNGELSRSTVLKIDEKYSPFNLFAGDGHLYILNKDRILNEETAEIPFDCLTFAQIEDN